MTEIPTWWLVLSGLFFGVNVLFFVGLVVALMKLNQTLQEVKPKVDELGRQGQELVEKVGRISEQVEGLVVQVRGMVDPHNTPVAGRAPGASNLMGAPLGNAALEKYAPVIRIATTAFRIWRTLRRVF